MIPEECIVSADENMLHTIVRNLISNALKYTHDNGEILIYTELRNSTCYLSVKDNGVGISRELKEKLFKADREATTPGLHNEKGSVLGLILCKTFVEQMDGNILVESQPGLGSTFTVTLKLEGMSGYPLLISSHLNGIECCCNSLGHSINALIELLTQQHFHHHVEFGL